MLVESLKNLVADLFKQSEEAIPIVGDGDKKEWMAYHLDKIIDEDGNALQCLLQFNLISDVINFLEKEYESGNDENQDTGLACELHLDEKRKKTSSSTNYANRKSHDKRSPDSKVDNEESVLIIDDEYVIIKDNDCGCR